MKTLTAVLLSAFLITSVGFAVPPVEAQEDAAAPQGPPVYVMVKGYAACVDRAAFHELMAAVAQDLKPKYEDMLNDSTSGCFFLKEGVEVQVVTNAVTFVEVRPEGMTGTMWTVPEALRSKEPGEAGGER